MPLSYIVIAFVLIFSGGVSGWLISDRGIFTQPKEIETTIKKEVQETPKVATEEIKKPEEPTEPTKEKVGKKDSPTLLIPTVQEEDINLKIAKCKAIKESSYDEAVLKINQSTEKRLKEVFDSLNQQYQDAVSKIYDGTDFYDSDSVLTSEQRISLRDESNQSASALVDKLYTNQQTFWKNQKQEIENAKDTAISEVSISLNAEYTNCLNM